MTKISNISSYYLVAIGHLTICLPSRHHESLSSLKLRARKILSKEGYKIGEEMIRTSPIARGLYEEYHMNERDKRKKYAIIEY